MEEMQKQESRRARKKPSILIAGLVGLAGAACIGVPVGMLVVPGLFAYLLLAGGTAQYLVALAVVGAGVFAIGGVNGLPFLLLFLPAPLYMGLMLKRKAAYFETALACAGMFAALLYLSLNLPDLLAGEAPFSSMQQMTAKVLEETKALPMYEMLHADAKALYDSTAGSIVSLVPVGAPAFICGLAAFCALGNLICCVKMSAAAGAPVRPLRKFMLWQLPKSFSTGMLILAAGVLLLYLLEFAAADAVLLAVVALGVIAFAVQGISMIAFLLHARKGKGRGMLIALIVLLVFTFPACIISLALVGLMEQFTRLRQRYTQNRKDGN